MCSLQHRVNHSRLGIDVICRLSLRTRMVSPRNILQCLLHRLVQGLHFKCSGLYSLPRQQNYCRFPINITCELRMCTPR
jgi:hypothetical protein